ncbi:hypothetical protein [Radiobacillus sp. PE A8.2]
MEERDVYKKVLKKVIEQTERLQINNSDELIQRLIAELNYHDLPKYRSTT